MGGLLRVVGLLMGRDALINHGIAAITSWRGGSCSDLIRAG